MENEKIEKKQEQPVKERKPFKKKGNRYSKDPRVVYVIGNPRPTGRLPWQLKLQAILDCARFKKKDNYKSMVESRYQELLRKEEKQ